MIALLEQIGPAVWRASWQAAALALVIALLLRCLGERLAPKWRCVVWGLVVVRLLVVATPASPFSAFNLARSHPQLEKRVAATDENTVSSSRPLQDDPTNGRAVGPQEIEPRSAQVAMGQPTIPARQIDAPPATSTGMIRNAAERTPLLDSIFANLSIRQVLSSLWLAGCLVVVFHLSGTAIVLRRRLAACRPVTDAAVLQLLETVRLRMGLKRAPALIVTPASISPSIVGAWRPRIVLPEFLVAEATDPALRHVLAHELAHLRRGDLWTNWLLLAARALHWFNPLAWWVVRQMQAEREMACDELALFALGEADHSAYARTIVDLAAGFVPYSLAPGMIGLFSSKRRLKSRVERLVRSSPVKPLGWVVAAGMLVALALIGLTDALPTATAEPRSQNGSKPKPAATQPAPQPSRKTADSTVAIHGKCVDRDGQTALAGIRVRLLKAEGLASLATKVAEAVTDSNGEFEFANLPPPRDLRSVDRLAYGVLAMDEAGTVGIAPLWARTRKKGEDPTVSLSREKGRLFGRVLNQRGNPVAGAVIRTYAAAIDGLALSGTLTATTGDDGRFAIDNVTIIGVREPGVRVQGVNFEVSHPDYVQGIGGTASLAEEAAFTLEDGCVVAGSIVDSKTGQPALGAVVTLQRLDAGAEAVAVSNRFGRYRAVVPEGRYNVLAEAKERTCVAITDQECLLGDKVEIPPLRLIAGGTISGHVLNGTTRQPIVLSDQGQPIVIGLYGPSHPNRNVISPTGLAVVDRDGRFTVRAAPGENFPFFVNTHGDRMAWDTLSQPAVVVKDGETVAYDILITPKIPPAEKLLAARRLVESLPRDPAERTARIILEFRKLNHTVDECELWCTLMRELVAVGPGAVPQLCAELDETVENRMLRRLGFALRAIGDPRAVPALIRAIPKTLMPASSDYGLIVEDRDLTLFMQKHDLSPGAGGTYFDFGQPVREIHGALQSLTARKFTEGDIPGLARSEDPRRQALQRRLVAREAQKWQAWWETHWREFVNDAAYSKVNLALGEIELPAVSRTLGPGARLGANEGWTGAVVSPAIEGGAYAWHFVDLDTGWQPRWPAQFVKDEARLDQEQLADWARETGVDLMCVTYRDENGTEAFVLRTFGLKAWEIGPRDLRNIGRLIAEGTLPEGRDVGDLLIHYDAESEAYVPDANAAFIFVTREGNLGLIETTDRVVRTQNLAGAAGQPPGGVGFHLGVRFNLRTIIP
jgi:beta-lactamase regulating signal transducer with metallopeptidase domain